MIHPHTFWRHLKYGKWVWECLSEAVKPWVPSSQAQFQAFVHVCYFQINMPECYDKETKETFKRSNLKARQTGLPNVKESEMKEGWREGDGSRQGSFSCDGVLDWMWRLGHRRLTDAAGDRHDTCTHFCLSSASSFISLHLSISGRLFTSTSVFSHKQLTLKCPSLFFTIFAGQHCTDIP